MLAPWCSSVATELAPGMLAVALFRFSVLLRCIPASSVLRLRWAACGRGLGARRELRVAGGGRHMACGAWLTPSIAHMVKGVV